MPKRGDGRGFFKFVDTFHTLRLGIMAYYYYYAKFIRRLGRFSFDRKRVQNRVRKRKKTVHNLSERILEWHTSDDLSPFPRLTDKNRTCTLIDIEFQTISRNTIKPLTSKSWFSRVTYEIQE